MGCRGIRYLSNPELATGVPLQIRVGAEARVAIEAFQRPTGQKKVAAEPSSRPYPTPRLSVSRHEA